MSTGQKYSKKDSRNDWSYWKNYMHRGNCNMACITISVDKTFKERLTRFSWINWSEIGRAELLKRYLYEKYMKTGKLTKDEEKFCEQIDWHPVDELPIRQEFVKKLDAIRKGSYSKPMKPEQLKQCLREL
jgi:hypothetical protein